MKKICRPGPTGLMASYATGDVNDNRSLRLRLNNSAYRLIKLRGLPTHLHTLLVSLFKKKLTNTSLDSLRLFL